MEGGGGGWVFYIKVDQVAYVGDDKMKNCSYINVFINLIDGARRAEDVD